MTEDNFPGFFKWTYTKWYFWVIVVLWSVWSGYESLVNKYIAEFIGTIIFVIIFLSIFFFIAYLISKRNCKKLGHL